MFQLRITCVTHKTPVGSFYDIQQNTFVPVEAGDELQGKEKALHDALSFACKQVIAKFGADDPDMSGVEVKTVDGVPIVEPIKKTVDLQRN